MFVFPQFPGPFMHRLLQGIPFTAQGVLGFFDAQGNFDLGHQLDFVNRFREKGVGTEIKPFDPTPAVGFNGGDHDDRDSTGAVIGF